MKDLQHDEMIDVLKKTPDGVLALSDGAQPYCIPFGFVYVRGIRHLSLACLPRGKELGVDHAEEIPRPASMYTAGTTTTPSGAR